MPEEIVTQESEEEVVSLLSEPAPKTQDRRSYQDYVDAEKVKASEEVEVKAGDEEGVIPDKFKGKSIGDVIDSYTQLEAELGRRGNEVGDLRKLADQLLELNEKTEKKTEPRKKVEVDSLLDDPDTTINEVVDSNPRIQALEAKLSELGVKDSKDAFEDKHPEWQDTMQTPEFVEWIKESPIRQQMLQHANVNYDYAMGTELFDNYDLAKGNAIREATTERDTKASKGVRKNVTEKGGASQGKKVKKFKRSELIHLKITNPAKYEAMLPEIKQAYYDKRVI